MPTTKLPIGNQAQYDHVTTIYQSLVNKGVDPQAAVDLVNQKVAEKGWTGWVTGDKKKYSTVDAFTDHLIEWMGRMYPGSLNSKGFEDYWKAIMKGKHKYNPNPTKYRKDLYKTRPGVLKRINHYRSLQNLPPLAKLDELEYNDIDYDPNEYNIT